MKLINSALLSALLFSYIFCKTISSVPLHFIVCSSYPEYDRSQYAYVDVNAALVSRVQEPSEMRQLVMNEGLSDQMVGKRLVLVAHGKKAALKIRQHLKSAKSRIAAVIVLGYSLVLPEEFGSDVPVLNIGGDLDGLYRVFGFALDEFSVRHLNNKHDFVLLNGMSHRSFAASPHPQIITVHDFNPEHEEQKGHQMISSLVNMFLRKHSLLDEGEDSLEDFDRFKKATKVYVDKILQVLFVESHPGLRPPCADFSDSYPTTVDQTKCFLASKWMEYAQLFISGTFKNDSDSIVEDIVKRTGQEFSMWKDGPAIYINSGPALYQNTVLNGTNVTVDIESRNEMHLSYIENGHFPSVSFDSTERRLTLRSFSENIYNPSEYTRKVDKDSTETVTPQISATQIKAKISSREKTYIAAGLKGITYYNTDASPDGGVGDSWCGKINNMAIRYSLRLLQQHSDDIQISNYSEFMVSPKRALDRYIKKGTILYTGKDIGPMINGFRWIFFEPLRVIKTDSGCELRSPTLMTSTRLIIAKGCHFCKLISPAFAMEWFLTDSFKN
ncbi:hypothetical protein MP638_001963 [Amoeboaphelidium occidentale]|nr:hypothetical protein MP638_001963 [Amoeboaphelidium occidentale]